MREKKMARTKMVARDYYRSQIQRYPRARFAVPKEDAVRVNNRAGRVKIKKLLPQFKNVEVKKSGRLIRKMTVRRKSIFPASKRRREY